MTPEEEATRRTAVDGIPRYITEDGRIMKCDWELSPDLMDDALSGETLEEYIKELLDNGNEV